jgi:hypothetical protein
LREVRVRAPVHATEKPILDDDAGLEESIPQGSGESGTATPPSEPIALIDKQILGRPETGSAPMDALIGPSMIVHALTTSHP